MFLGMIIDTTGSHLSQDSFGSDTYDHYFRIDCDKSKIHTADHWTQWKGAGSERNSRKVRRGQNTEAHFFL